MIISLPKSPALWQHRLFEQPLGNHGHCRTVIGDLCELLTAKVLGGRRHRCHSADYCPDVSVGGVYLECKAMGRSNSTFIYGGRLEKDARFIAAGHQLFYAVWSHHAETKRAATVEELQALFLQGLEWLAIIPFEVIDQYCLWQCPAKLNSSYGGTNRKTYGSGYRIPRRVIEPWKYLEWEYGR